jgi:acetylornithine deacetylase/succinyl-diaminopimelate desuccinylase-like protein
VRDPRALARPTRPDRHSRLLRPCPPRGPGGARHNGPKRAIHAQILCDARAERGWGEQTDPEGRRYTLYERTTIRPALTINGIAGGYQGPGGKAIIPGRASAKISFRLVPDQDPETIERLFRAQVARLSPARARVTVATHLRSRPVVIDTCHPAIGAAAAAYRKGFGAAPVLLRSGGSIPVVNMFKELLAIPTVLMGFALPGDRMHAPNERFELEQFFRGVATCIHFWAEMGNMTDERRPTTDDVPSVRRSSFVVRP